MDFNRTEALLDKYFDGKSTEAEEMELRQLMLSTDLPENLKESAVLFQFYQSQGEEEVLGDEFDQAILAQIDIDKADITPVKSGSDWGLYMRVAASVIVVSAIGFVLMKNPVQMNAMKEDTYDDPQQAYEETKRVLLMLSSKMNENTEKVQSQLVTFAEAQKAIEKQ